MHNLVRDYQVLSRMPCEKVDPRLVFNDTVNYRKVDPDRCGNCVFCVFHDVGCGEEKDIRLFCSNKKNLRHNEYARELLGKYAKFSQITNIQDTIEVDCDCVCDNYHRAPEER